MIYKNKPRKLWRGKKRIALKWLASWEKPQLEWAINIKPGDWIGTCNGCNRQVVDIQYRWYSSRCYNPCGTNIKTQIISEVRFEDTNGRWHYCPGGGCAFPVESIDEIESYYKGWIKLAKKDTSALCWDDGKFESELKRMEKIFNAGDSILDNNGQFLPEFDPVQKDRNSDHPPQSIT